MNGQSEIVIKAMGYIDHARALAIEWATTPAAWSQFALLIASWLLAAIVARNFNRRLERLLRPPENARSLVAALRRFLLTFLPLILPLLAYGFTAIGESVTRSLFGSGEVIAFGKRVFLFIAARVLVRHVITDPFLRLLGRYVLMPVAALYVFDLTDEAAAWLSSLTIELGNIRFSMMALIRGLIAGSILFWLGTWSNKRSSDYIKSQAELRPATRELAAKAAEITIYGIAFLVLLNIMGINLTTVAVLGGALGVGIGLGLQQIAANFISGIILLVEGETTVGDFVELDGGEEGTIIRMTARACILETFDGKWIMVPNQDFITTRVTNYSDQGSANRYEVAFSVSYETDINRVPEIIISAVEKLPFVLSQPERPDVELRNFGESSVDFAVEYWVNGIDDGRNKYSSEVMFAVWNALKEAKIDMPYPHRVVEIIGGDSKPS